MFHSGEIWWPRPEVELGGRGQSWLGLTSWASCILMWCHEHFPKGGKRHFGHAGSVVGAAHGKQDCPAGVEWWLEITAAGPRRPTSISCRSSKHPSSTFSRLPHCGPQGSAAAQLELSHLGDHPSRRSTLERVLLSLASRNTASTCEVPDTEKVTKPSQIQLLYSETLNAPLGLCWTLPNLTSALWHF